MGVYSFGQLSLLMIITILAYMNEFIGAPYYSFEDYTILSAIIVPIFGIIFLLIGASILKIIYKTLGGNRKLRGYCKFHILYNGCKYICLYPYSRLDFYNLFVISLKCGWYDCTQCKHGEIHSSYTPRNYCNYHIGISYR